MKNIKQQALSLCENVINHYIGGDKSWFIEGKKLFRQAERLKKVIKSKRHATIPKKRQGNS